MGEQTNAMEQNHHDGQCAVDFTRIVEDERELIRQRREPHGDMAHTGMELSALSFSGGGIRSAIFNLGFIQGLANHNVLHLFDYLSTVSGGGYIGGWLSSFIGREIGQNAGEAEVRAHQGKLATPPREDPPESGSPEAMSVRYLRRYANYLTPMVGISGDTLTLISILVRNITVMQMLLVSLLVAVFAGLLLLAKGDFVFDVLRGWGDLTTFPHYQRLLGLSAILLVIAFVLAQYNLHMGKSSRMGEMPNSSVLLILLCIMCAGNLFALGMQPAATEQVRGNEQCLILFVMAMYGILWWRLLDWGDPKALVRALFALVSAGLVLGLVVLLAFMKLPGVILAASFGHVTASAPLVTMLVCSLVITIHLALAGPTMAEQAREWWARAGGQGNALALLWALAFLFLLYMPPLLQMGAEWSVAGGGLWAAISWYGANLARGPATGGGKPSPWKEIVAKLVPWVFLFGLLALIAWIFASAILGHVPTVIDDPKSLDRFLSSAGNYQDGLKRVETHTLFVVLAGAMVIFLLLVKTVDLNLFSAHSFYAYRLARTFLGASRRVRNSNPYTGFDSEDDMKLTDLAGQRPIHIINANLNLDGGQELAWQTRRGASFVFTPLHCGYDTYTSLGKPIGGYRRTDTYAGGELSLSEVVAASGAAASPNMGFHTSTAVAALLTAFNLRLARWCPNPVREHWKRATPKISIGPLFAELTGEANGKNKWVNISDGGHFDNLGIYELVRRRVGLIFVTDVGADDQYQFDDLAMAVRKIWVDLGVEIVIDPAQLEQLRPQAGSKDGQRFSQKSWIVGRIDYPDRETPGYLVYVKSSMTAKATVDIRQYRHAHDDFPHQATVDQWFDEDQFEAYRHLGQIIAENVCDILLDGTPCGTVDAATGVRRIREKIGDMLEPKKTGHGTSAA